MVNQNQPPHLLASFFCNYCGTILGLLFWLLSGSDFNHFLFCICGGAFVDVLRHYFAPDLQLTAIQRHESFLKAVADENFAKANSKKFITGTMWIYLLWVIYIVAFISIEGVRTPSNLTNTVLARLLVKACAELYPATRIYLHPLDYPVLPGEQFATLQFLTVSWWVMIIGTMLEIFGGAFYRTHDLFRKMSIRKVAGRRVYARDAERVWFTLVLFLPLYFGPAYYEFFEVLPPKLGAYSRYGFLYPLIINGLMIICCAFLIRVIYAVALARCSDVMDLVGNMDKTKLEQICTSHGASTRPM